MNGILCIDKPAGMTSRDVVNKVSKYLHTKKIGHTGTLDPLATGVLVLCIGNCSKLAELITTTKKTYIAEVMLGMETDTLDNTGTILKEETVHLKKEQIESVLTSFLGTYNQQVPAYSAVKKNGQKLYEYARKGIAVDLPSRPVTIEQIELVTGPISENSKTKFTFKATVSKGTYIRSLIRDIANQLGTVGVMTNLRRVVQGEFTLNDCYQLEEVENNNYILTSKEEVFKDFTKIKMDELLEVKVRNGALLENEYGNEPVLFTDSKDQIIAIYKLYEKDNNYIKPWKTFFS